MIARRLGLPDSRTASTSIVSVFREPAAPPKKRMSAEDVSAAWWAAVLGDQPAGYASARLPLVWFPWSVRRARMAARDSSDPSGKSAGLVREYVAGRKDVSLRFSMAFTSRSRTFEDARLPRPERQRRQCNAGSVVPR